MTKAEDDKYKSAEAEYTVTIKEYDYSSMNNSLTGTMLQGTKFYVEAPILSLASDNQAVYVVRKGDEWIEADKYQLMPQQGDNRQTLVIARKDKESGAITDIGSLRLDYKYDTQPPKITLNPKEDDKPAFTKDAVDYYGNVRKVDMNIHDVSLDDGSTQLWVKVDDREEFDVFDVDNAQKLIDAGIEYSEWIVTGADYSSCITFGTKADEEHKYQIIGMYAKDQAEHECNDTSSIEQPFYVDRKAPSGTIGYDADLIDEQNMVSQQASNVYGQLEDISGIKQAFYYVNKSDESGSILNDEQVKALDDSAWKPLELIEDTYDARYKYKINTSDLKDTSYNVYVKAQDNCNGETAFFSTSKLVVDTLPPELTVSQDTMTAADEKGWHKDDISYIVKADDSLSGIKSVEYTVFDGKRKIVSGQTVELDASGEGRITIPATEQFNGIDLMLSVKATDYAGLKTEVKGDSFKFSMDSQSPDVSIEPEAGKNRKYFNDDVRIKTSVADSISGVVSAKYQIVTDDQSVSDDEGAWNEIDESGIINVSAEAYLDKKVDVYVKAVDEAGNVTVVDLTASGSQPFYIHKTAPAITVTYGTPEQPDPQCISSVKGTEYYRENRIATISVKENELFFDPDETKINVKVDGNEQTQSDAWSEKSYWVKTGEGAEAVYSKQLVFNAGHKYELSVSAKDLCGNSDNGFEIEGDKSAEFVIDVQSPTGNIRFDGLSTGMDTVWDLLLPKDKYEISRFAAKKVNIAGQLGDEHGGIKSAEYFVSAEDAIIDVDSIQEADWKTLDSLNEDGTFSEPIECENKNCVVYVRVTDLSGNVSYISTNGLVVDTCAPAISVITPETASGVYSADVPVSIEVSDENATGVASGIKSVNYTVTNMGQTTQDGTLYSYDKTAAGLKDLENHVTEQFDISAASNNSNEVRIDVTATDKKNENYNSILKEADTYDNYDNGYYTAIVTDPTRTEAYIKLNDKLTDDFVLDRDEAQILNRLMVGIDCKDHNGRVHTYDVMAKLKEKNPKGYEDVCYKIGESFLFYYEINVEKDRYSSAAQWFKEAKENHPEAGIYCEISDCLTLISQYDGAKIKQTEKTYEEYKKLWKQINELYAKSEDFDSLDAKIQVWNEIDDIVDTNITSFIAVTDKDKVMDLLHTIKDKTEKLDKSIMREQITGLQDNIDKTIEKAQSVKEENKDDL